MRAVEKNGWVGLLPKISYETFRLVGISTTEIGVLTVKVLSRRLPLVVACVNSATVP